MQNQRMVTNIGLAVRNRSEGAFEKGPTLSKRVELESGTLALNVAQQDLPLETLCGFASRSNPKRGYLFVSKVLGKHYPVRPSAMDDVHRRLAEKLSPCDGSTVVVGMAETATALGHGVYEHLLKKTSHCDLLYQHTTRYALQRPLASEFAESHSHAPQHLLHQTALPEYQRIFKNASQLILVDDEISTGATLANLALAYRRVNPTLASLQIVSLTNWLSSQAEEQFRDRVAMPTEFHQLLRGSFEFTPNPAFLPPPIPALPPGREFYDDVLPNNFGRLGIQGQYVAPSERDTLLKLLRPDDRILVLGTGEFAYPPFELARWLESRGYDIHFQTTTRSPILLGNDISSTFSSIDNCHEGISNFVYNVADRSYTQILLCYETPVLPRWHDLPEQLKAILVFFEQSGLRIEEVKARNGR